MSPMLHCIKHSMEDIVHYRCIGTTCYTYLHLHLHSLVISTSYNSSLYFRETEICMAFFRCMQQISTCDQFLAKFCGTTLANVCKRSSGWIRYHNHIHITQPSAYLQCSCPLTVLPIVCHSLFTSVSSVFCYRCFR